MVLQVSITLRARDFSVWDVDHTDWVVTPGTYAVAVGASSGDFRLTGSIQ